MKKDKFYVYILSNSLDEQVFYVGKCHSIKVRLRQHLRDAATRCKYHVHHKINKILSLNGNIIITPLFKFENEQEAYDKEIEIIRYYGRENLTNLTDGGSGPINRIVSDEIKKKLSERFKDIKPCEQALENSKKTCSRPVTCVETNETFATVTLAAKAFGTASSLISRAIQRNGTCKGYHWISSKPRRRKITFSEEVVRQKSIKAFKRPIICIETGEIFPSLLSAAKFVGVSSAAIIKAIKHGWKCSGYYWSYVVSRDN